MSQEYAMSYARWCYSPVALFEFSSSMTSFIRWNVTASGARPNPQGSFHYGSINVTEVYVLKNKPPVTINGKRRTTLSGVSFVNPSTPIRLADQYKLKGVYKLDFPSKPLTGAPKMETSVINGTYRGFMEVILQNNDTKIQSYHMSGYAFFVAGYGYFDFVMFRVQLFLRETGETCGTRINCYP